MIKYPLHIVFALAVAFAAGLMTWAAAPTAELATSAGSESTDRLAWWREARFGMFIHWGFSSVPAGTYKGERVEATPEWLLQRKQVPLAEFEDYASQFDAKDFDADALVKLARQAGMKYLVITAKHHDGFAMYDTKVSRFNIMEMSPAKRDIVKELSDACRKHGIRFGFYYSQIRDWYHPGGGLDGPAWDERQKGDFAAFIKNVSLPQMKELLTNYGPISVVWFDSPLKDMTPELAAPFDAMLKQYQPRAIYNSRLGGGFEGDFEPAELYVPMKGFDRPWETCMTINKSWGYKSWDERHKTTAQLIDQLVDAASKGGNYLLNVGPDSHGNIPDIHIERLKAIGAWMSVNGEAIYGTSAGPFARPLPFGYATSKAGKLYLHVFDWPKDQKLWLPVSNVGAVTKVCLLAAPDKPLKFEPRDGGLAIMVPAQAPTAIASVVTVELAAPVQTFIAPVDLSAGKAVTIGTPHANPTGAPIRLARIGGLKGKVEVMNLAPGRAKAEWDVKATEPLSYDVAIELINERSEGRADLMLTAGSASLKGVFVSGGAGANVVRVSLGQLNFPAGESKIVLRVDGKAASVYQLTLTPSEKQLQRGAH